MSFEKSMLFIILTINLYQYVHFPVTAKEKLIPGDELMSSNSSSNLISSNGMFTLGFFTISSNNFTYLGIWYTNEKQDGITWVANRDKPFIGDGVLRIDDSGALKVVNEGGITLFNVFYNQVGSWNNTSAVLSNSGNFFVYDSAESKTLWQSFDHLTDTLIPGMKIGYNLTTKQNWTLTSSLGSQVLGSGAFTMKLEQYQNSSQLLIYRREEIYWASGPWNNGTFQYLFSNVFTGFKILLDLISDTSGMYVVYTTGSASSLLMLHPTGYFSNVADYYALQFCYGRNDVTQNIKPGSTYDIFNEGCVVSAFLNCHGSYMWKPSEQIPDKAKYDDNQSISIGDCMERCWNDCNCGGCTTNVNGTGCITWTQHDNLDINYGGQSYDQVYILTLYTPPKTKIMKWLWIVVSIAGMLTFVLLVVACLCCVRIRRRKFEEKKLKKRDDFIHQLTRSNSFNLGDELEKSFKDAPDVKLFSFKAILAATNNFSNENRLGQGSYGAVYKGELIDGRKIAVKRLFNTSGQGILEFKSELTLISKLQHTNLVRLYGCCIHEEEKMLIYEFMPNKSLDFFLFDEDRKEEINWQIRFNIIEGVAQGLLYLHKYSRMKVIHRDLKVSNVLLDENMNPKIADFGMARSFHQNVTEEITNKVTGTYGYMAPEYAMQGTFSIKSDVFSFGVLILEILSGKKNSSFYNNDMPLNLVGYAWELWKKEETIKLKDIALNETYDVNQLLRCVHVGLLCVQENANDRPTISEIVQMLNRENFDLPNPKQPAFLTQPNEVHLTENLLGYDIKVSVNSLTFTTMEAR